MNNKYVVTSADMYDDDSGEKLLQVASALSYIFSLLMESFTDKDVEKVRWGIANGAALIVELDKAVADTLSCDIEYVKNAEFNQDYIYALVGRVFDSFEEELKNDVQEY